MFFNPTLHTKRGVPHKTVVDGLVDGIQAAEKDFGVPCRLIADVYRQDSPAEARRWSSRSSSTGATSSSASAWTERRRPIHRAVRRRLQAWVGRPAADRARMRGRARAEHRDLPRHARLRADRPRVPHPRDDALVERCRDEGITFTVCPTATAVCYFDPEDYTTHPIREMAARGLKIMVNSDDPSMFHTDIGTEYVKMANAAQWGSRRSVS